MFDGITELTKLKGIELLYYSTKQSELIDEKNTQKNKAFIDAKTSIIDEFNAAINSGNSDDLRTLLNNNDYNGTEGTDDSIGAVIGQLDTIIKVNSEIKSMNTELETLETEMDTKINSLSKLNAENEKKNEKLKAENANLTEEIGKLKADKKSFEENNNKLNDDIRSSKASLELKKQKLQTKKKYT